MRYTRAFFIAAALAVTAPIAACSSDLAGVTAPPAPASSTSPVSSDELSAAPATKAPAAAPVKEKAKKKAKKRATSDLSGIKITGIKTGESVVIDVVDDGEDGFLAVGDKGVDFTGTDRTDTTMMSLYPAAVSAPNRVVIKPTFWNEDLGEGSCVADTTGAALKLETCKAGKASQVWRVVLAGDSGLFELHGAYGVIGVDNGHITATGTGRTGLQVLPYAE